MKLQALYEKLYTESLPQIRNENHEIDRILDAPIDNRYGLSLIIQPSKAVEQEVSQFLSQLRKTEPAQYYYAPSQIHVTVLSIISCYEGFRLDSIEVPDYIGVVEQSLQDIDAFEMNYHGLTLSKSGLMLQGYPKGNTLERLRDQLRRNFTASGLQESMDQRYKLTTAHATIMRFRSELKNPDGFVENLQENRSRKFGKQRVTNLRLVFNDWYHRKDKTKFINEFHI